MKRILFFSIAFFVFTVVNAGFPPLSLEVLSQVRVSFYQVPLVCGAAPEIGCGSRLKPLFLDMEKEDRILEAWSNRQGTVVAIIWENPFPDKKEHAQIIRPIFLKNDVDAHLITNRSELNALSKSFNGRDKWYKGMEVDLLSIEEAGIIAESLTKFANDAGLITSDEKVFIKNDFESYFKKELTQVRSFENLNSQETQEKWKNDGYQIYVHHIGEARAMKVSEFYHQYQNKEIEAIKKGKSCCDRQSCKKACCKKSS